MLNTCIASSISLRTRGSFSLTTSDYSHCSNRRSRFAYSSSTPWCSCSCNSLYTVPSCPNYCSSLYGVKQSSLIQWSSYRRPISSSFGYHARLPACGIDRMSDCDKFCNSGKRSVGKRRGVLRKCFVDNERCERYEIGGVDEAEAILNLLADDLGEEGFLPKKKSRRLVVEKRESCNVCRECGSQKNRVDVGVSVSDIRPINSSMKDVSRRRKERIPSEDSEEAILREGHKGSSLKNRREEREGVERGILFRKARERGTEEKEELLSRKHRQMVRNNDRSRTEEKEEHRQKSRKDGSSCSSYYSFSSNGNEVELAKGDYVEGSSTVIKDTREDDQRLEDYREDHLPRLANRSSSSTELGVVECEFRKKSEKRLDDIPVEEMEKRNGALLKESKSAMTYRHNNEKSSDYVSYDSRKEKPTESVGFDEERKQQHRQRDAEVSRQSETEEQTSFSHKHFETNDKRDESSTAVRGSIDNAEHQQQYHQVSCQVELKGKFQKLMKKDSKSILKRGINEPAMQEDTILASRDESDELNKVIVTHFGNTGTVWVEDRNKNKSDVPVRPPTDLQEIGTVYLGSTAETAVDDASKGSLQLGSTTSHGQPARFISDEYVIGSVDELESSSAHYVEQVRSETLISETQREKESYKTKILHGESSGDPQSNEHDLVCDNQQSGLSGAMRPSHEMSEVNKPPIKESLEADEDNARKDSDVIVKRTGRSLWNIIADIARLRWSHSESHDSGRKTGGRSSSFQSTSSEKWRNEAEENEAALEEIESTSSKRGLSGSHQPGETGSQSEESVSSSKLEGRRRNMGIDTPSSLVTQEKSSLQASTSLRSGGEISGDASFPAITDSIHLPALRMQKSPSVQVVPEAGEAGTTGLVEQIESVVNVGEVKQKKLQKKDQVVSDRFDEWEEAYRLEAEQRRVDEIFMREALSEAQKAADNWEVPVGAVLVQDGKIIARGCNLVEELRDSTAHAEIICIREASNKLRSWRLSETTLYVTLEPCPMCAGAILQARIDTLIWGAPNKLLGADGSWIRLFPGDGGNSTEVTDKPAAPVHPFHPKISIRRGVLAPECADAMQHFFKRRRKKDKKAADTSLKPPSCLPISSRPSNLMAKMHDAFTLTFCL